MYGYYRRYRHHMNWLTPFARGLVHGIVLGVVLSGLIIVVMKTLG